MKLTRDKTTFEISLALNGKNDTAPLSEEHNHRQNQGIYNLSKQIYLQN